MDLRTQYYTFWLELILLESHQYPVIYIFQLFNSHSNLKGTTLVH
jgi:hypothetical protein